MRYRSRLVRRAMILAPLLLLVFGAAALVSARREQAQAQQAQAEARKAAADAQAATLRQR
jgi:cytochrome c-type biogenesis protein CcmH/NrfF